MAKKTLTQPVFDYTNEINHIILTNMFCKIKPNITVDEAIEAHKLLFNDFTKPVTSEDILEYFKDK